MARHLSSPPVARVEMVRETHFGTALEELGGVYAVAHLRGGGGSAGGTPTSDRPVVLRVERHGGHGIGSTMDQENALLADELAFLLHAFGLDEP